MRRTRLGLVLLTLASCSAEPSQTLAEARRGHATVLTARTQDGSPVPVPPAAELALVSYPSRVGKLAAYLSPPPRDGARHPAIIWLTGGDSNTLGRVWGPQDPANDQSAAAFRRAGIVTLYPSLHGGNSNPGVREGMYGEVDDVLAAADFLKRQPGVDPERIYLGGHSTGGTLALLVAEADPRFRATFAFGPIGNPADYGPDLAPPVKDEREIKLRSPIAWLASARSPVFVIEGDGGNADSLKELRAASRNPQIRFLSVPRATHFSLLAPATALIAQRILADKGGGIVLTQADANALLPQ
jgi:dienelactone hydrolase